MGWSQGDFQCHEHGEIEANLYNSSENKLVPHDTCSRVESWTCKLLRLGDLRSGSRAKQIEVSTNTEMTKFDVLIKKKTWEFTLRGAKAPVTPPPPPLPPARPWDKADSLLSIKVKLYKINKPFSQLVCQLQYGQEVII